MARKIKITDNFYFTADSDQYILIEDKFMSNVSIFPIIKVISEIVGDDEGWIEWYVYEKDWGIANSMEVTDENNNNIVPSETLEDLWKLIQNGKEGDKTE